MAAALKLLFTVLLLYILSIANGQQCDTTSIKVETINTGMKSGFDFVFEVTVTNNCPCTTMNVFLYSDGFMSSMQVDPRLFRSQGGRYLVNDGNGILSSRSLKFYYAWDHWWTMSPAGFQVACP